MASKREKLYQIIPQGIIDNLVDWKGIIQLTHLYYSKGKHKSNVGLKIIESPRVLAHPPYKACADLGMSLNGNDNCD